MLKKLNEFLTNDLEIRERLFRVILLVGIVVGMVGLLLGIVLNGTLEGTVPLALLLLIFGAALWITVKRRGLDVMAVLIGLLLLCVIFPVMFFTSGGIEGGATIWFVLGILYVFMMFTGWQLRIFVAIAIITDATLYYIAYNNQDWIIQFTDKRDVYYDSLFSVLTVGLAVGGIIYYQLFVLKRERETILQQKEELEQISKSKDLFFANMSHEIRTPINTIIGLNEMILREENLPKEVEEDAYYIQKSSKMLLELMNDILDLSKIESKSMEIVPMKYNTEEVFRDLVGTIQVAAKNKKLEFVVNIDENMPSMLYGDEMRIQQIVLNLLTNAVKYTEKGTVTLSVNGEASEEGNFQMKISVADTGMGIRKEDLEHLYDAFHRVDQSKNRKIEGTGLGLSISRQLVELMDGEITVDSVYRNGSTFTVTVPQQVEDATPIGKVSYLESEVDKREHYRKSFEAKEARVLIVDDNENNLMVAKKLLKRTKVQIDFATSGKECLEQTKVKFYHLILLDHMMPEMDGFETLTEIRKQENGMCKDVPVIVLTANTSSTDEKRYLEWGFDGYVPKPIDGMRLEAEVLKNLPEEVVEYRRDESEYIDSTEIGMNHSVRRRKKMIITTDCISDLPQRFLEEYDIRLIHLYIKTAHGYFQDAKEIDADNFSRYFSSNKSDASVLSATVEEYEAFYAEMLLEAEEVVHISLAKNVGKCYENAIAAAKGFDHVHVIDSEQASTGEGLLVLCLANLAKQGYSYKELQKEVDRMKGKIRTRFLLPSANIFYNNGFVGRVAFRLCERFDLHPVIGLYNSKIEVCGVQGSSLRHARKGYIRNCLFWKKARIDKAVLYIVHAGCSLEEQQEILTEVKKYVSFDEIIMQKASVSSACNAGIGAIGMSYLMK